MKPLLFISLLLALSCSVMPEGELTKTKFYIGKFKTSYSINDSYYIETNQIILQLKDSISVEPGSFCYVRIKRGYTDFHPDISWQIEKQYFVVGESEVMINKNVRLY